MEDGTRVLLVSSRGGVLLDILALREWWEARDRCWLVVEGADTREALVGEDVRFAPELTPRSAWRVPLEAARCWRLLSREHIGCVLSAGTGVAVPVFLAARLRRLPTVWVETRNVVEAPGLAARIGGALATVVLVQHPRLLSHHRRAVHVGTLY